MTISAVLMYFQLGHVQTYTDLRVYYGILATNVNPIMTPHSDAVTELASPDALPKL